MDYEVIRVDRRMTAQEATALVGDMVEPQEPNVTSPCVLTDSKTDEPVFAYLPIGDRSALRRAVLNIQYGHTTRASGLQNASRTFGNAPRKPVYGRDGCKQTKLADESPAEHQELENWADRLEEMLAEIAPGVAKRDRETLDAVNVDWRIGAGSLWTSGVINRSSRLPYHRDGFNFPTWSAMPVLRRKMDGGYLSIPEYDITCACRDGYALFFAGHELVHGVTPMQATASDGYRYSVVYYALRGMKDCFTYAVETAHAKRKRTEREREMARRALTGEPLKGLPPQEEVELDPHREHMEERAAAGEVDITPGEG